MCAKCPEAKLDNQLIGYWRDKMSRLDRSFIFSPGVVAKGRMIWAANVVRSLDFKDNCVVANVRYNNFDEQVSFDIDQTGELVSFGINLRDKNICSIVYAVCLSIDQVLSTFPEKEEPEVSVDEVSAMKPVEQSSKYLLVKISLVDQNLVIRAFLDNDERKPIFMQSNRALSMISGDDRKISILRLLFHARKSNCKFCLEHRDYRISNLRDAVVFYTDKLPIWQKYFNLELSPKCELLSRGLLDITTRVHVTAADHGKIKIEWDMFTKCGPIHNDHLSVLLKANGRAVFLENIGVVLMSNEQVDTIRRVLSLKDENGAFPYYLLYFLFHQSSVIVDTNLKKVTAFTEESTRIELLPCLKDYQVVGVRWMRAVLDYGCQCLLADEMGLGKTLQVLSLICADGSTRTNLIVCPASVLPVWEAEINKFFPTKTVSILGSDTIEDTDFVLTSYNQARRLNKLVIGRVFDYVVLDEAQYIKNSSSKTARACCGIESRYRIAVTGTPIENNLNDVWSIFKFLMPGLLYNYREFQKRIVHKEFRTKLRAQIAPFILRRTKDSVRLQLPERNEIELLCTLNSAQQKIYSELRGQLSASYQNYSTNGTPKDRMNILTAIMRMRQVCDCVDILPKRYLPEKSVECPKLDTLMLKLGDIIAERKKTVIFSQFLGFLSKIGSKISESFPGCKIFKLTGATGKRKELVKNFQEHDGPAVVLISLKAGGVGITLHSAEYAFLMEPWWNPAVEEQAIARIHRIGQEKITTIYRLIAQNTIEQKMRNMQAKKKHLFDEMITDSGEDVPLEKFFIQNISEFL